MRTNKAVAVWQKFFRDRAALQQHTINTLYKKPESVVSEFKFWYGKHRKEQIIQRNQQFFNEMMLLNNGFFPPVNEYPITSPHALISIIKKKQFNDPIFDAPYIDDYLKQLCENQHISPDMLLVLMIYTNLRKEFGDQVKVLKVVKSEVESQFIRDFIINETSEGLDYNERALKRFRRLMKVVPEEYNFAIQIYGGNFAENSLEKQLYEKIKEPIMPRHHEVILFSPLVWQALGLALYGDNYFYTQPMFDLNNPLLSYTHQKALNAKLIALPKRNSSFPHGMLLLKNMFWSLEAGRIPRFIRDAILDVMEYIKSNYANFPEIMNTLNKGIHCQFPSESSAWNKKDYLIEYLHYMLPLDNPLGAALFIAAAERKYNDNPIDTGQAALKNALTVLYKKWDITSITESSWYKNAEYKIKVIVLYIHFLLHDNTEKFEVIKENGEKCLVDFKTIIFNLLKEKDYQTIKVVNIDYEISVANRTVLFSLNKLNSNDINGLVALLVIEKTGMESNEHFYNIAKRLFASHASQWITLILNDSRYNQDPVIVADLIRMVQIICPENKDWVIFQVKAIHRNVNFLLQASILSHSKALLEDCAANDIVASLFYLGFNNIVSTNHSFRFLNETGLLDNIYIIKYLLITISNLTKQDQWQLVNKVLKEFSGIENVNTLFTSLEREEKYPSQYNFAFYVISSLFLESAFENYPYCLELELTSFFTHPLVYRFLIDYREKGDGADFYQLLKRAAIKPNATYLLEALLKYKSLFICFNKEQERACFTAIATGVMTYHIDLKSRVNLKPLLLYMNEQFPHWIKAPEAKPLREKVVNFIKNAPHENIDIRRINQLFWMQLPEHEQFTQVLLQSPYKECFEYYQAQTGNEVKSKKTFIKGW